jgi:hypothetical protein
LTFCGDPARRPADGSEIAVIEMELPSQDAVDHFLAGQPVSVRFNEKFRGSDPALQETSPRPQ